MFKIVDNVLEIPYYYFDKRQILTQNFLFNPRVYPYLQKEYLGIKAAKTRKKIFCRVGASGSKADKGAE